MIELFTAWNWFQEFTWKICKWKFPSSEIIFRQVNTFPEKHFHESSWVAWDFHQSVFIFTSSQILDDRIKVLREIWIVDLFICHKYFTFRADFVGVCARYQYILPSGTFIIQIPQNRVGNIRLRLNYCVHSTEDVHFAVVSSAVMTKIHNRMNALVENFIVEFDSNGLKIDKCL